MGSYGLLRILAQSRVETVICEVVRSTIPRSARVPQTGRTFCQRKIAKDRHGISKRKPMHDAAEIGRGSKGTLNNMAHADLFEHTLNIGRTLSKNRPACEK